MWWFYWVTSGIALGDLNPIGVDSEGSRTIGEDDERVWVNSCNLSGFSGVLIGVDGGVLMLGEEDDSFSAVIGEKSFSGLPYMVELFTKYRQEDKRKGVLGSDKVLKIMRTKWQIKSILKE